MSKSVTVIDYGAGNLLSVARALEYCGATVVLASEASEIEDAGLLVLPGVGAFADGMRGLSERGLIQPIRRYAASGRPLLGICLGMQMLVSTSEEFGDHEGLDLIKGRVRAIPRIALDGSPLKAPHIGWSELRRPAQANWTNTIFEDIAVDSAVYLVHSYSVELSNAEDLLSYCEYGGHRIASAIRRGSVYGCQFHPEKSGPAGLRIMAGFLAQRQST